jgi:cellobiose phosphorylase|nr:MAG TPA: hypothetical protein [Herelleviridae sp.]
MWVADGNTNSLINLDNVVSLQITVYNPEEKKVVIRFILAGNGEILDVELKNKTIEEAKKIMNEIIFQLNTTTTNVYWIG